MFTRRSFLRSSAAAAFAARARSARAENVPGVTDAEIKIGQTAPYSGPLSAYGVIGRIDAAYFKMVNDQGGVNGRRIKFISLDDAYSPPKTVEQTRRLVEQEQVAFIFGSIGTPTNAAVRQYLNDNKVLPALPRKRRLSLFRSAPLSLDRSTARAGSRSARSCPAEPVTEASAAPIA
jgi:branched-chain amino acid transport system substrate-binding protein